MSFFTALGAYLGGRGQARQQAQQNEYAQQELGLEAQRDAMQNRFYNAQLQQLAQQNEQTQRNRQFEAGLQLPKGWGTLNPDQRIAYLTQRYNAAQRAGDQDVAQSTLNEMNALELGAERSANAQYMLQGELPRAQAAANMDNARGFYYRNILGVDLQKARMTLQAAKDHDAARVQAAQIAATAGLQRAGIQGQALIDGRVLAGYYALQGRNAADATQMAIAASKQANDYAVRSASVPGTTLPGEVSPYQMLNNQPPVTINVGAPGGSLPSLPVFDPSTGTYTFPKQTQSQQQQASAAQIGPYVSIAKNALQKGMRPSEIRQQLEAQVHAGKITEAQKTEILRTAGVPLATGTQGGGFGGSNAANPFP